MKLNENQKITLTIGQLKRLVRESMEFDRAKFDEFVEEVKDGMGDDFVDVIDAIDTDRQFAFATNEEDQGEHVRGKWLDLIISKLEKYGWYPGIPVMPFPVRGRLVYVLGMRRFVRESSSYVLDARFDPRKSFGGKAKVETDDDGTETLYSYGTPAAKWSPGGKCELLPDWDCSQTTKRHVREFFKQHGEKWPPESETIPESGAAVREARFARFPKDNDALLKHRMNKFSMETFGRRLLDGMKNVESFREDLEELEEIVLKNPDYLEKVKGIDIDVDWDNYFGLNDTPGEFRFFSEVDDKMAYLGIMSYDSDGDCETVLWYRPSKNLWHINVVGEDSSDVFEGTSAETVVKELYAKVGNKLGEMGSLTGVIDALNNKIDSFLDNIEKQFSELMEITEGRFRKFLDKGVVMERHVSGRAARRERKLKDKNKPRPGKY